jgi:hypothetical protein
MAVARLKRGSLLEPVAFSVPRGETKIACSSLMRQDSVVGDWVRSHTVGAPPSPPLPAAPELPSSLPPTSPPIPV